MKTCNILFLILIAMSIACKKAPKLPEPGIPPVVTPKDTTKKDTTKVVVRPKRLRSIPFARI